MVLKKITASDLDWHLDFSPNREWPQHLPVVAVTHLPKPVVVAGFERKQESHVQVLIINEDSKTLIREIWPDSSLLPLERLRLQARLGRTASNAFLLSWPSELQNFFDSKQVPLKALKPLEYLGEWMEELCEALVGMNPTNSEIREILDLLCDLKMRSLSWQEVAPNAQSPQQWLSLLKQKRFPVASDSDQALRSNIHTTAWPKGVDARLERRGDHAFIAINARVSSLEEWNKLKKNLQDVELGEDFWN